MRKGFTIIEVLITLAVIFILAIVVFSGFHNSNISAKQYGGSTMLKLQRGYKLITTSWKGANLWTLSRPMREDETAETYEYAEHSTFGIIEGKVIIVEEKLVIEKAVEEK